MYRYEQIESNTPLSAIPVGIGSPITELIHIHHRPLDFPLHVWGARIPEDLEATLPEASDRLVASGIADTDAAARISAIGEAVERYAFALLPLETATLPVQDCSAEYDEGLIYALPFLLPADIDRQAWATAAVGGACRVMPATRISGSTGNRQTQFPVAISALGTSATIFQTTNGMACGKSLADAGGRALLEVIERDALMLLWLYRRRGVYLDPSIALPGKYEDWVAMMAYRGVFTLLQEISTIPGYRVVLASVYSKNRAGLPELFSFGAGAALSLRQASEHAFREACLGWKGLSWRRTLNMDTASRNTSSTPRSFVEHADRYMRPEEFFHVSFLFEPRREENVIKEDRIAGTPNGEPLLGGLPLPDGRDVYLIDLTPAELAGIDACVVKVVAPGLAPFTFGEFSCEELARNRQPFTVAGETVNSAEPCNLLPHPWP